MESNQDKMERLIDRYLRGECTEDEARIVNSYFNKTVENTPEQSPIEDLSKRKRRVWKNITPGSRHNIFRTIAKYSSIAAVLTLVFLTWQFFNQLDQDDINRAKSQKEDIAPGSYGAKLILGDGRTITLDSARQGAIVGQSLTYDDGSPILGKDGLSLDNVVDITATTAKGQVYTFTLPDGTKVWLNADSRLTFPSRFLHSDRHVNLEGEGYFIVKHDPNRSFFVESKGQLVEDLGTAFNIQTYATESSIKTTLVEGSVKVNDKLLVPGQQSIITRGDRMDIVEADIDQVLAWQNGDFVFRGETLEEVFRSVARWYNIEVRYEREEARSITVGGTVSRSRSIRAVLDLMETTGKVKFKVSGNVITVI